MVGKITITKEMLVNKKYRYATPAYERHKLISRSFS